MKTICSEAVHYRKSTKKNFLHVGIQKDLVFCVKYIYIFGTKNTENYTCTIWHVIIHVIVHVEYYTDTFIKLELT